MGKVKPDGHIWALEFNRYVCFSFRGNIIAKHENTVEQLMEHLSID